MSTTAWSTAGALKAAAGSGWGRLWSVTFTAERAAGALVRVTSNPWVRRLEYDALQAVLGPLSGGERGVLDVVCAPVQRSSHDRPR